jgi:hypothetical protein
MLGTDTGNALKLRIDAPIQIDDMIVDVLSKADSINIGFQLEPFFAHDRFGTCG